MGKENKYSKEQLNELIELVIESKKQFNSQKAYARFNERTGTERHYLHKTHTHNRWLYIAATFIPFIFLSHFTYKYFNLPVATRWEVVFPEVTVPYGSKTQMVLQDGTKIWINSGSTIQCDKDFGREYREIKLSGEAYLEVAHREDCPFIVSTNEIRIKVLGTKFNINAYSDNDEIKVSLLDGALEMDTENNEPILLYPDDVALYNPTSKETQIFHNAASPAIGWIRNKLFFEGETFEQIILSLERNFNVKINLYNDTIRDRRFVGDFVNNETIEQIFNVISSDGKFKYKIKGNVIDVY